MRQNLPALINDDDFELPPLHEADHEGLLALTTDFSLERILLFYQQGAFPWFQNGYFFHWYAPDPRCVLLPHNLKISKSMQQVLRSKTFEFKFNTNFAQVMLGCATTPRNPVMMEGVLYANENTWINSNYFNQYTNLQEMGYAVSGETYYNGELVGGLYGVLLGQVFYGESMFATKSNASKFAFINTIQHLQNTCNLQLIDCQMATPHLQSLGATTITSKEFAKLLKKYSVIKPFENK